jgi:hypothetical protein
LPKNLARPDALLILEKCWPGPANGRYGDPAGPMPNLLVLDPGEGRVFLGREEYCTAPIEFSGDSEAKSVSVFHLQLQSALTSASLCRSHVAPSRTGIPAAINLASAPRPRRSVRHLGSLSTSSGRASPM